MKHWNPNTQQLHVPDRVEEEFVVVVDVIRAFTTAAHAFAQDVEKIILVSSVEEAFDLKRTDPTLVLMGEVSGFHIEGFDFGNSPGDLVKGGLEGKTLVQRTSAGTQGVVRSARSKRILVSSFVVAEATLKRICHHRPETVTFVITGMRNGDEDRALADYLEHRLRYGDTDPRPFLQRVIDSPEGRHLVDPESPLYSPEDLKAVLEIDKFPFAMEVTMEEGLVLRPYA